MSSSVRRRWWLVCLAVSSLTLAACTVPGNPGPTTAGGAGGIVGPDGSALFDGADSPWSKRVPADAPIDPKSAAYVTQLLTSKPLVSVNGWTIPVYEADAATPKYPVTAKENYVDGGWTLPAVPIPDSAAPDPQEDGHMVVVDHTSQCVYEMWQAKHTGDGWTASWVNATPADGTGVYRDGLAARAAGMSAASGLIWPQELAAGKIDHALIFAYPSTKNSGPVAPATANDGQTDDGTAALPEGAHLRLDPSIDLDSLDLPPEQLTIARALQQYGMILGDTAGGFTLYAAAPQSFTSFPYPASWSTDIWADISKIPFDHMQVLSLPPPTPKYSGAPVTNRCTSDVQMSGGGHGDHHGGGADDNGDNG